MSNSYSQAAQIAPETPAGLFDRHPSLPYIIPFIAFLALLAVADHLTFLGHWEFPLRVIILAAVTFFCSRHVIDLRVRSIAGSVALGAAVFAVWVAPDMLFPGYRHHWLFQNAVTGTLASSIPEDLRTNSSVMIFRFLRAVALVPIIEELFWRAWLMRWLVSEKFQTVRLGTYSAYSMWVTAVLFACEHGPYWDVGLAAGLLYNWWMVRTKSLGDCILAHAVTNAVLSGYVMWSGRWEYWL
jgi:CAAX prenyl protease-like protein